MPLSLLFLQLFTHGLIRVAMLPFGIRQCFSVTYCTVSTTRTMRKCQLFLGKPQLGGRKYITANRKLYPAFPTGNDCRKLCSSPALRIHPRSQARTGTFCLSAFGTMLHHDTARASGMTHVHSLKHGMRHFFPTVFTIWVKIGFISATYCCNIGLPCLAALWWLQPAALDVKGGGSIHID